MQMYSIPPTILFKVFKPIRGRIPYLLSKISYTYHIDFALFRARITPVIDDKLAY